MYLRRIANDGTREKLKNSYCVLVVFPDEYEMDVFINLANRYKLALLAKGSLKNAFNRMRRFVYTYVDSQRKNLKKYREDLQNDPEALKKYRDRNNAYQKKYYKKHKRELNENKRFSRAVGASKIFK